MTADRPPRRLHPARVARGARRRPFLVLFGLFLLTTAASAAWHPLYSAPDEPAHVIRAAAVARGQFRYSETTPAPGLRLSEVRIPRVFADSIYTPQCFFFKYDIPASCAALPAGTDDVRGLTGAGRYPPLYYLLVGGPSLLWKSNVAVYMMRLASAALCSLFLAQAVVLALQLRRPLVVAGVAAATTPMVLYLAGVVNPNGPEIAAAVCLWTALVAIGSTGDLTWRGPLRWAVLSAVVVASMRPIGPLWVLLAVAVTAAAGALPPLRSLLRSRAVQAGAAVVGLAAVASIGWVAAAGGAGLTGAPLEDTSRAWILSVGLTGQRLTQMVAYYGWLDAPVPFAVPVVWGIVVVALVGTALVLARGARHVAGVLLLIALVFAVPIPFDVLEADQVGLFWQGRYTLPVAVGLPILAAVGARRSGSPRWIWPAVVIALVGAHLVAVTAGIRRFAVGLAGPVWFFGDSSWSPPAPHLVLGLAYLTGLAGAALFVPNVLVARTRAMARGSAPRTLEGGGQPAPSGSHR